MTEPFTPQTTQALRDARLAKALQHAPDADALPNSALRDTIKTIAAGAINTRAASPLHPKTLWWKSLWASTGSAHGPWGGALATLVLGCVITVMWYGQEVPDEQVRYSGAASDAVHADVAAPPAAPTTAASPAPAPAAAPVPIQPPTRARARADKLAAPQEERRTAAAAPPLVADKAKDQTVAEVAPARREAEAASGVAVQATVAAAPVAAPLPSASLAPAPTAPAGAVALHGSSSVAAKAPSALRQSKATDVGDWQSATVQYQGRTTQLAAADAKQLGVYVMAVVNTAASANTAAPIAPAVLRIAFADAGQAQAVFTLRDGAMQWQRAGQADVLGVPQTDALAALLAHVRSLPK